MITKYKMKKAKKGKVLRSPQIIYAPNLNTILMVEKTLQNMPNSTFKMSEVKRALPVKINHYTLKNILEYLDESNKIYVGIKGITWIHNDNPALRKAIREGFEYKGN
jgi:hypothetical protein